MRPRAKRSLGPVSTRSRPSGRLVWRLAQGRVCAIDPHVDHLLVLPVKRCIGGDVAEQIGELIEDIGRPVDPFAGRKTFPRDMPLAAQDLPWHERLRAAVRRDA